MRPEPPNIATNRPFHPIPMTPLRFSPLISLQNLTSTPKNTKTTSICTTKPPI